MLKTLNAHLSMFQIHRDGKECQIKEYHKEKKQTGHQQLTFSELK